VFEDKEAGMPSHEINTSDEPIRLFKSDFMEFFTHIHPLVVLLIWLPVVVYGLWRGAALRPIGSSWAWLALVWLLGLFIWTLSEYVLHRFLFHYPASTPRQERIFFLFHGVHHAQPRSKTRLVMPPVLSIPLAAVFYGLFWLVLDVLLGRSFLVGPMFAGFISGYLTYDMLHYSIHHFQMRTGYWKMIRRHHMHHHFQTPNQRFGVSSPLWDHVFGTYPE
jgi:sterol desaturase/sphingolipid hydroxylase (fatty acid hydroxylase superfamily)